MKTEKRPKLRQESDIWPTIFTKIPFKTLKVLKIKTEKSNKMDEDF